MTLSELIKHVGDENVRWQKVDDCLQSSSTNKKGVTTLTLKTEAISTNELMFGGEKSGKLGLLIWIPKDRLPTL